MCIEVKKFQDCFRIFTSLAHYNIAIVCKRNTCFYFPTVCGRNLVRFKDSIRAEILYDIRTRIISPILIVRAYAYRTADLSLKHLFQIFCREFRINDSFLIPLCISLQCLFHFWLHRSISQFTIFSFNPDSRVRTPCRCQNLKAVQILVLCQTISAIFLLKCFCDL